MVITKGLVGAARTDVRQPTMIRVYPIFLAAGRERGGHGINAPETLGAVLIGLHRYVQDCVTDVGLIADHLVLESPVPVGGRHRRINGCVVALTRVRLGDNPHRVCADSLEAS